MKLSRILLAIAAIAVVCLIAIGPRLMVLLNGGSQQVLAPAIGGPFTLVDQDGRTVTDADYRGRYTLMFFGYTFCPDVCPTALATVAAAFDTLSPQLQAKLVPIFVTVDPKRDTPAVMKEYVAAFHPAIIGLTGSDAQIAGISKAFKVYAAKVEGASPDDYTMDHTAVLYLMGPDGRFVAPFTHGLSAAELAAGLKKRLE
jgi:protein SCO1/2